MKDEHGMPIYIEFHRGHRSGEIRYGVFTGLIEDFTQKDMDDLRQQFCVVIGLCEEAFRSGMVKRYPCKSAAPIKPIATDLTHASSERKVNKDDADEQA